MQLRAIMASSVVVTKHRLLHVEGGEGGGKEEG